MIVVLEPVTHQAVQADMSQPDQPESEDEGFVAWFVIDHPALEGMPLVTP